MADPSPSNTVKISLTPLTPGGSTPPNIHDDNFVAAINSAKAGGSATQSYFDSTNQTADYWTWLTNTVNAQEDPWAPGTDPDGNPIQMSSNGNLDVRMGAFYRDPNGGSTTSDAAAPAAGAAGDTPAPTVGIATIQTHNTTTAVSSDISFGLSLAGIPAGIVLSKALFGDLIQPIYANLKTAVNGMAEAFKKAAEVDDPDIDPEEEAEDPLDEASGEAEDVGGELAEEGAKYVAIDWGSVGLEAAGMGALVAIPMIVGFLGHKMVNSLVVHNLTDHDFTWQMTNQFHGQSTVLPDPKTANKIPKMDYNVDSWGDKTTVKVAYQAMYQFTNSTDLGSIGWLLTLTPDDGSTATDIMADIPWATDNTIAVGEKGSITVPPEQSDGQLTKTAKVGEFNVTIAITALSGETGGAYFYGVIVTIEPA
ncbi:hypothetical protein ACLESD_03575 [Pyxidicoccus sp. 3LFB2]